MTGFASTIIHLPIKDEEVTATINLKSLNSRFFEGSCRMPHQLAHLEQTIIKKLKTSLYRGSVYCTIHLSSLAPLSGAVHPSLKTIEDYLKSIQKIHDAFGKKYAIQDGVTIKDLIQLPHVFEQPEEPLNKKTTELLLETIDLLIKELIKERLKEGTALRKDLEQRAKTVKAIVTKVEKRTKIVLAERKHKLLDNAEAFFKEVSDEAKDHQLQQIYSQLDKLDVHEEVVRLKTHLKNLSGCIANKNDEKGKKLDFILQELFREINTIAAKCSDSELSDHAINIKVELEKAREQAQNIV
jgi:uncharacterized protein (TIGR00255 family)